MHGHAEPVEASPPLRCKRAASRDPCGAGPGSLDARSRWRGEPTDAVAALRTSGRLMSVTFQMVLINPKSSLGTFHCRTPRFAAHRMPLFVEEVSPNQPTPLLPVLTLVAFAANQALPSSPPTPKPSGSMLVRKLLCRRLLLRSETLFLMAFVAEPPHGFPSVKALPLFSEVSTRRKSSGAACAHHAQRAV